MLERIKRLGKESTPLFALRGFLVAALLLAAGLIWIPAVTQASTIYVDVSETENGDGSLSEPYNNLEDALKEAEDDGDTVRLEDGTYQGSFTIPAGVQVEGDDKDKVIIEGSSKNKPVIAMEHETAIRDVTIKGGEYGVYVEKESGAIIEECQIQLSEKHGIKIKRGALVEDWKVRILGCDIEDHVKNGIYVERRIVEISDNKIENNGSDGIFLEGEVIATVIDNKIQYNSRGGMDVMLDSSDLTVDDNLFKGNDKSAIEAHAVIGNGFLKIDNCDFEKNGTYAVRRVQHNGSSESVWIGLEIRAGNKYKRDKKISDIKRKNK